MKDLSGEFKGLLFAKFPSMAARDSLVESFKRVSISKDFPQWVKPDLPVFVRAPHSFLFSLKRILVDWNFNKSIVRIDTETNAMKVYDKQILKVTVVEGEMMYEWEEEWRVWAELHDSHEMKELVVRVEKMLQVVGKGMGKKGH